jgi:protease-4
MSVENNAGRWEAETMKEIVLAHLKEQRRARRWKIFFRLLFAAYIAAAAYLMLKDADPERAIVAQRHVAVVDVRGEIASGSSKAASADHIIKGLRAAFDAENAVAVVLRINSPGGSPVQSAQVYRAIQRLKAEHPNRPVYAVAEDIAASGAYYIAAAADKIYADPSSLVGSVGVIMGGFGFSGVMDKVGIERRVYTAGEHKAFMDPFSQENPDTIAHAQTLLADIHKEFIDAVRKGRGDRVKGTDEEVFNGLIWTGNQALEIGLIDGLGSVREIAMEEFGVDKLISYSHSPNPLERLADRMAASFSGEVKESLLGNWQLR